jgi:hypothetical protein
MRQWVAGIALMIVLTAVAVGVIALLAPEAGRRMYGAPGPLLAGWALASANALGGHAINRRAMRAPREKFLRWAVGANILRFALLFAIVAAFLLKGAPGREAFLASVFCGYFTFQFFEVVDLSRMGRTTP